jgi:hypothetical protein
LTPGADQAALTAASCSAHEETDPESVTLPSDASTRSENGVDPRVAFEGPEDRFLYVARVRHRRRQTDLVHEPEHAEDVAGDEFSLVALLLPVRRSDPSHDAFGHARVDCRWDGAVEHKGLQHSAAQVGVDALALAHACALLRTWRRARVAGLSRRGPK